MTEARHGKVRLSRVLLFSAAAAAIAVAAGLAVWRHWPSTKRTGAPLSVIPVTSYPGRENTPSFSPDGSQIAFSWDGEKGDNSDIYVKVVGENRTLRLTSDPRLEFSPAWSPDGRHIAFCRDAQDATEIVLIPALGGPERIIAALPKQGKPGHSGPLTPFEEIGDSGQRLAWFPDAQSLAFVARKSQGGPIAIFRLSVDSGEIQQLTFPPERSPGDLFPAISRDGHHLAFIRLALMSVPPFPDLYVVALTAAKTFTGEPRRLTTQEHEAGGGLVWISDNRRIVFASARGLWSVALDRGVPEPVSVAGYVPMFPAISAKDDRLAFVKSSEDLDIWRIDGPAGVHRRIGSVPAPPTRLISSTRRDTTAQYSHDGNHIAFASDRGGTLEIWVCDADGSNPAQITNFDGAASPRWSPDGRYIAFDSPGEGRFGIYVVPAQGGPVRRITPQSSQNTMASWSRDGKWIYFESDRTGASQIWKMPFAGGDAAQVTHHGGAEAFESRDGKFVYYAKKIQPGIWRVPTDGGAETLVVDRASHFHWGLFDNGVCLIDLGVTAEATIDCLDFRTNRWNTIAKLPKNMHVNQGGPSFSVSPGGGSIIFVASDRRESDIMLVENFRLPQ